MSNLEVGYWSLGLVLLLIAVRVPIGVALGGVGLLGLSQIRNPDVALGLLKSTPYDFSASWHLSAIPMFILMGAVAHNSGLSHALFRAAGLWFGRLPGGLAVATNIACAGFAAASGSSVATAATMGKIAIPEMLRRGYSPSLATGVVASAGTLGALIPPSILFVLYGVLAEVSIPKLLIAGILPGILTAAVYTVMIITRCWLNPKVAPRIDAAEFVEQRKERWRSLLPIWPLMVMIVGIIGGLYAGIFSPTEAGAAGALISFLIAIGQRRLTRSALKDSLRECVTSTARIFFVAIGAVIYTKFLAFTGVPATLGASIGDWAQDPLLLVLAMSLIFIVLGMFLDPLGVLLLTLPILLPMFQALELDLVWIGVLMVKYLEIGMLTPPVGFNVYVIKSVVGDKIPLETIFRGVGWFLACEVVIMAMLILAPEISLWLPGTMFDTP